MMIPSLIISGSCFTLWRAGFLSEPWNVSGSSSYFSVGSLLYSG